MVVYADTVVDPRAVMVVPLDASVAHAAVARSWSFDDHALRTKMKRINHLHKFLKSIKN